MRILLESPRYPTPDEELAEEKLACAAIDAGHHLVIQRPGLRPVDATGFDCVISLCPRAEATMLLELGTPSDLSPRLHRQRWPQRLLRFLHDLLCLDISGGKREFYAQSQGLVASCDHRRLLDIQQHYHLSSGRCLQLTPPVTLLQSNPPSQADRMAMRSVTRGKLDIPQDAIMLLQLADDAKRHGVLRTIRMLRHLPPHPRDYIHLVLFSPKGCKNLNEVRDLMKHYGMDDNEQLHLAGPGMKLGELLLAADVLLHPVQQDDHPYAPLEALASSLPVICTAESSYHELVNAAGFPVIPVPFHSATMEDAFLLVLRELKHVTEDAAATSRMLHESNWAAEAIAAATARSEHAPGAGGPVPPTPAEVGKIIAEHRRLLSAGQVLKDQGKRAVTRVILRRENDGTTAEYIVKEFRKAPWWHLRNQLRRTIRCTALMNSYTPSCLATFHASDNGSDYAIFASCGESSFYHIGYAMRPDAAKLYASCGELLARLHTNGLYHKDAKSANYVANDNCGNECPYPVCLVDCDNVVVCSAPLPLKLRVHNIAQFIASCGKLAENSQLFYRMMGYFRNGYINNFQMSHDEAAHLWLLAWKEAHYGKHIERNLPDEVFLV